MLSRINLFILKNPSVLITKTFFRGDFPLFFFLNAAAENPSPCARHIADFLQQRAGVMIEIMKRGKKKNNGKAKGGKMMGLAHFLGFWHGPTVM